jgi:hypothetical protein
VKEDDLRWELEYDGWRFRETEAGLSIRLAAPGAKALNLMAGSIPVFRIDLESGWLPIFYRKRYLDLRGGSGIDAVVFGRARSQSNGDTTRFAGQLHIAQGGFIRDCPPEHIDGTMIALQAMGA